MSATRVLLYIVLYIFLDLNICSECHRYTERVTQYETDNDDKYTPWLRGVDIWCDKKAWTRSKSHYWVRGLDIKYDHHNEGHADMQAKLHYGRPDTSIFPSDYSYNEASLEEWTSPQFADFTHICPIDSAIASIHTEKVCGNLWDPNDREFTIGCRQLPKEYSLVSCGWTSGPNDGYFDWDFKKDCPKGLLIGIKADFDTRRGTCKGGCRRMKMRCCDVEYTPMWDSSKLVIRISSSYKNEQNVECSSTDPNPTVFHSDSVTAASIDDYPCSFEILSVDHSHGDDVHGKYFNFDIATVDCILSEQMTDTIFDVFYSGTNSVQTVKVWRKSGGGSIGDGHGRLNSDAAAGDWETGQRLAFASKDVLCKTADSSLKHIRKTSVSSRAKPTWYKDNGGLELDYTYTLTKARPNVAFWQRICPQNGAFTSIEQYDDGTFSFECGKLNDEVFVKDCKWSDYLNVFHGSFEDKGCAKDGVIRGIGSYYSFVSYDMRLNLFCCELDRGKYNADNGIKIKVLTASDDHSDSNGVILFDLCWNNVLYQGIETLNAKNMLFVVDEIVEYDSCGNERTLTISMDTTDTLKIESVGVEEDGEYYSIESFDFYNEEGDFIRVEDFSLDGISVMDVAITFPNDYITACSVTGGCIGELYNLGDFQQYMIGITPCASFNKESGNQELGVVLRGLKGNLDKVILSHTSADESPAGQGNIGDLMHISIEHETGPDFCIESITVHDPYNGKQEFGTDYFGDGIVLSHSCSGDGHFRSLTGIQYIPCYDTPFSIQTYETSLYTSIQIHCCDGLDSGISAANTALLTLTIVGMSKNDRFIQSDPLSLQSADDWQPTTSRDYTLQLSGDYHKLSFITLSNNNPTDAFCVDSVLINGEDAFLAHYWVGLSYDAKQTIPAILQWPICDIELTTTITAETSLPLDPLSVATSTCVNRNRLVSVDCDVSQTFETYEEVAWQQETGKEVSTEFAIEAGTTVGVSAEVSAGTEAGMGGDKTALVSAEVTVGSSMEFSASMSYAKGQTDIHVTTDGKVNGESVSIECSGGVSVPPSQQISYSLLIDRSEATLTTLTDMKMTKCSAYLYGDDEDGIDADDYIYIYGIEGELRVKKAINCYVEFSHAEKVSPNGITCNKERVLATREWGTYVPQCDEADPEMYNNCQCAFGDSLTLPTCGCVDPTSGNLLDTQMAAVVAETETYKWTDWCDEYCHVIDTNDTSAAAPAAKAQPQHIDDIKHDAWTLDDIKHVVHEAITQRNKKENLGTILESESEWNKKGKFGENMYMNVLIGVAFMVAVAIYAVNSFVSWYKQLKSGSNVHKYPLIEFESDTEVGRV